MKELSISITLPDNLGEFVERQIAEGGYHTPSDYLSDLIRQARERQDQDKLESLLIEGLDSGKPIEGTEEYWDRKRSTVRERRQNQVQEA